MNNYSNLTDHEVTWINTLLENIPSAWNIDAGEDEMEVYYHFLLFLERLMNSKKNENDVIGTIVADLVSVGWALGECYISYYYDEEDPEFTDENLQSLTMRMNETYPKLAISEMVAMEAS